MAFKHDNVEDLYDIGIVLGSGHFGQVRSVTERATGTQWAGKFIKTRKNSCSRLGVERSAVEREVMVLQALQHPNIMTLKDVFESRAEMVLIVELISGGELFDFIAEKDNVSETEAIDFLKQILEGVCFMHSKQIGHFDLKPENIMLSDKDAEHPNIKLIDFGLAHQFKQGEEYRRIMYKNISERGDALTRDLNQQPEAPEVINYDPLSTATDMWSIGVITYILLSGLSPFQDDTDEGTLKNILAMKFEFPEHIFNMTSDLAKDFIQKLLVKDPSERMTAEECLIHQWIKPLTRQQRVNRNRSSINMKNFKKFNAKRKWKMSYNMVRMCNRFLRLQLLCRQSSVAGEDLRDCESDLEDTETKPASLMRRRLSSSS